MLADEKKFGWFADGRTLDLVAARIASQTLSRVTQNDNPSDCATLTAN